MRHRPVLLDQVVSSIFVSEQGLYIDATFGRGGHSKKLLETLAGDARLLVVDRDEAAISEAHALAKTDSRVLVAKGNFSELAAIAERVLQGSTGTVDGVMMDLGVSSPQLDEAARGFSFMQEGPLDMRMDTCSELTAEHWIRDASIEEMTRVFKELGEERFARRIAVAIDTERHQKRIKTTTELSHIILSAQPFQERRKHGATRVFQAIRMHINQELEELEQGLHQAFELLAPGGRLAVLSFQSLEDRLVKRTFREWVRGTPLPRKLPVVGSQQGKAVSVVKKLRASDQEVASNTRARSAVLRVVEKVT